MQDTSDAPSPGKPTVMQPSLTNSQVEWRLVRNRRALAVLARENNATADAKIAEVLAVLRDLESKAPGGMQLKVRSLIAQYDPDMHQDNS